jgi:hypothetical protein
MEEGDSAVMSGGERGIGRGRSTNVFASELAEGEVSLKLSGVDLDLDDSDGGLCRSSLIRSARKRTMISVPCAEDLPSCEVYPRAFECTL